MDKKRVTILAILCTIGFLLTVELAYIFYKANFLTSAHPSFCSVNATIDCDGVAKTPYSMFLGVPLALWGMFLYLTVIFLTILDVLKKKYSDSKNFFFDTFKNPRSYIATLGLTSFLISLLLAGISIFTIGKICALCFVTYFIDLSIACTARTSGSFFIADIKNTVLDFIDGAKKYPWLLLAIIVIAGSVLTYTQVTTIFSPNQAKAKSIEEFRKLKTNPYAASGNQLGKQGAPIQVYIYSDFLCPFCRITNIMIHKLAKEEKDVEIHHMNFPLDTECNFAIQQSVHPGACTLAKYALAAKDQDKYWDMVTALYTELPRNEAAVLNIAAKLGLNAKKLEKDAHSQAIKEILNTQINIAQNINISGTPTIVINGIVYMGGMSYTDIKTLVKQAQKRYERDNDAR